MKKILAILFLFSQVFVSQTRIIEEYDYFTNEVNFNGFGYLNADLYLPFTAVPLDGIRYSNDYNLSRLGKIPLTSNQQIDFFLEGSFRIGLGTGSVDMLSAHENFPKEITYYLVTADFFSLTVSSRYTFVLENGYAVFLSLGLNLLNIGGSIAIMDHGVFKEHSVATVNLVPLAFSPTIFFDFGNTGIGFSAYFNSTNLLSFVSSPKSLFGESERGIVSGEDILSKVEMKIIFVL